MFKTKASKLKEALKKVLTARLAQFNNLGRLHPRMDEWSQGYVEGQKEAYAEIIEILDGVVPILEPKK